MNLILVEWNDAPKYWTQIEKWVEDALESSLGYRAHDILLNVVKGDMQLWLAEENGIQACAVTQLLQYPRARICSVVVIAGKEMDNWIHFETDVLRWAKEMGCKAIEGKGRKGWERKMAASGYVPVFVVYRKDIR